MATPMTAKERDQILRKVRWVCGYIVRGRDAKNRWAVFFYRAQTIAGVILSVLAGAGVIVVQNGVVARNGDLITLGGILALATGVFSGLYHVFEAEKSAVQALAARDAFDDVYDALEVAVKTEDPTAGVNAAKAEAEAHLRSFRRVIKMKVAGKEIVDALYAGLLAEVDVKTWKRVEPVDLPKENEP